MKKLIIIFIIVNFVLIGSAGCSKNTLTSAGTIGSKIGMGNSIVDYADVFTLNGTNYHADFEQVITDDKIIETEVGTIKFTLTESNKSPDYILKDGDATFLKVGTKIYSLKKVDKKEALAAKNNGKWTLYKAVRENNGDKIPSGNGITDDTFKATALIVEGQSSGKQVKIQDKEKIKIVIDGIKNGLQTKEDMNYPEGNTYTFYFVVPDNEGIGKIVYKYYFKFQDINLSGYVRRFNDSYKIDSSVSKIITESFEKPRTIYDNKLGGKQQIYDIIADGKFILRKVVKETPTEKFSIKTLKQGEEIWEDGNKVKDTLKGKYKVEVFMKDTKLQEKIINILTSKKYNMPGVVSIYSSTTDGGNSSVIYLSYDVEPDLYLDETADSFVLVSKN